METSTQKETILEDVLFVLSPTTRSGIIFFLAVWRFENTIRHKLVLIFILVCNYVNIYALLQILVDQIVLLKIQLVAAILMLQKLRHIFSTI